MSGGETRLVVFSDDWGRHPSSSQHITGKLLHSHRVLWVNTIGTRMPRLSLEDLRKVTAKLAQWTRPAAAEIPLPAGLQVINPKMFPGFRRPWQRNLNDALVSREVVEALGPRAEGERRIAITTLPLSAGLVGRLDVDHWVYYCVDDFSVWPGLDGEIIDAMERELVAAVDQVVCVSETLQARIQTMGRSSELITHGIDLDHWQVGTAASTEASTEVGPAARWSWWPDEGPVLVFWGVVDRRLDTRWCRALSEQVGQLVLVGPQQSPDPDLLALDRIRLPGPMAYAELPALAQCADVLVMPYADLPVTRAMQPLKLKEYLATGKPSIVRALPATRPWAEAADVVANLEALVPLTRERCEAGIPASQLTYRQARLREESWEAKAHAFAGVLSQLGDGSDTATRAAP